MADVLYIWLFAMLGVNAFVIVLALVHATNEAAGPIRDQSSWVGVESWLPAARRQCRSPSFSLARYLELLSIPVPRERRAHFLISCQCCSTRAQERTLRPFSGKPLPKISDLQRMATSIPPGARHASISWRK